MDYGIKNFSKADYHADNQNWSVCVGPHKYIYVANNSGLLVYDGINWEFFTNANINNIRTVKVDCTNERIYTAGYREIGYWQWDSLGILHYVSLNPLVEEKYTKNEEFWNIMITSDSVVFQSFTGIFIYQENQFEIIRPFEFINTMAQFDDQIYLSVLNKGIYKLGKNSISPFITNGILKGKSISFLLPLGSDSLFIGTSNNGFFLSSGKEVKPVFESNKSFFQNNTINRGALLNGDIIVVGTILNGIVGMNMEGDIIFRINEETGLQNNTVLGLDVMDNALWASLDRGISFIKFNTDPSYKIFLTKEVGATYSAAFLQNKFYIGTNQGLYCRGKTNYNKEFRLIPGTQGQVWDCSVIDERLFVGHNSGTFVINDGNIHKISNASGGFNIIDNTLKKNALIQSTYLKIVFYEKLMEKWTVSHHISNFYDLIRYIELDHLNNLWASHMRRGVFRLKLNDQQDSAVNITYYGKNSVFGKEYGIHVFKLENRIVFTTGDQLFTYDDINDSIISYDNLNDILGKYITAHRIVNAGSHHYWFITKDYIGLFFFQPDQVSLIKEYPLELFGKRVIKDYENIVPFSNREAILCLENGYALLNADTTDFKNEIHNQAIHPRSITIYSRSEKLQKLSLQMNSLQIPYNKNNLRIQYAFPYHSMTSIQYRYFVENLDESWSSPLEKPFIELERIPAGKYTLNVLAINAWNENSRIHKLFFEVLPPWYNTIFAWILYILFIFTIVITVRYFSIKKIKEREKEKRELKEKEVIQLRNQNLRNELSFKSRELASSTMSIINKHEFLLKLKDILKKQKYELGSRYPDKYYNYLVEKIDQNISGGDDWKNFESYIEQAHEEFTQKLVHKYPQLSHSDLRLCTYLRMNLSSKEIAPLMRISVRGVENHRYRIRKKLNLSSDENLTDFILAFEVI